MLSRWCNVAGNRGGCTMQRITTSVFFFCLTASSAYSAVLQIDDNGAAGQWNHLDPVQTGTVGSTRVRVESTAAEWESNGFTDESASYANTSLYGSLAQPAGTVGDLFNQQIFTSTGSFTWTVTFLDPISDPIFYFGNLDNAPSLSRFLWPPARWNTPPPSCPAPWPW